VVAATEKYYKKRTAMGTAKGKAVTIRKSSSGTTSQPDLPLHAWSWHDSLIRRAEEKATQHTKDHISSKSILA
jgi:hypothetical protein